MTILLFILGFVILVKGADVMIEGSSSIARKFGLSSFFIGLTIVAFGTSAPELFVSALAGLKGNSGIAFGNIIGSNITNTLLILGVSAVIAPLAVKKGTIRKEILFSLLSLSIVFFMVNDFIGRDAAGNLARIEGIILLVFFALFVYYTLGSSQEEQAILEKAADTLGKYGEPAVWKSAISVFAGLAGLIVGAKWIVNGAVSFAAYFGLSEILIGLTIVAVGTSLPELAASAVAARKGKADIAIGNIIGSNIFNLLLILGASAVLRPMEFDFTLNTDFFILFLSTVVLIVLIYAGKRNILARWEGFALMGFYAAYTFFLIARG